MLAFARRFAWLQPFIAAFLIVSISQAGFAHVLSFEYGQSQPPTPSQDPQAMALLQQSCKVMGTNPSDSIPETFKSKRVGRRAQELSAF